MKKYLVLAPFMALSLVVSCQSNASKATTIYGADDHKIEIFFDAGAGVYDDGLHARSMKFMPGYTWKDIKAVAPSAADIDCGDSIFNEWKYSGGGAIADNDPFNNDTILIADYTVIKRITVTIDPNGGHWAGTTVTESKSLVAFDGDTWGKYYDSYVVEANDPNTDEFKYWTVNDERINNTYQLKDGDVIKAFYATKGTTTNFVNDSWPVFIEALNKGFDFIKNNGHDAGGYQEDLVSGSFVGLTRTIRIYNKDYIVRVIGEGVDTITGHSGKYATLTFQFENAIENAVGWNSKDDNDYKNTSIRTYLNDQFIDALPDDIIENIVSVDKYTYAGGGTGKPIISTSEKMFLPSLLELHIASFTAGGITVTAKNEGLGATHTDSYAYYSNATEGPSLIKKYKDTNCNYWLRSPDAEGSGQAWYVDDNGYIGAKEGSYSVQYGLAIAPCFALGEYLGE